MDPKARKTRVITLPNKTKKIALRVRAWAEQVAAALGHPPDLCGMCAIASSKLHHELTKAGIDSNLHYADNHVFVVSKGRVVDVTATQFGPHRKVASKVHKPTESGFDPWRTKKVFDSWRKLRTYQKRKGWPTEQVPNSLEAEQWRSPSSLNAEDPERYSDPSKDGNW